MKYLVFEWDSYYPDPGPQQVRLRTNDQDEALQAWSEAASDHACVYDTDLGMTIKRK